MVDIHAHVLPGLDDGPRTLEEAAAMLEVAARAGTTDLVATPHSNFEFQFNPELISEKLSQLESTTKGIVRLHRGCDFHLSPSNIESALRDPARYTINHKRYLLVEFSDLLIPPNTREILQALLRAGMVPIVTHPERNFLLHSRLADLGGWIEDGCLLQVTGLALLGKFGAEVRRVAHDLMSRNMVHFIASDCHDAKHRSPDLRRPFHFVEKEFGEDSAHALFIANPQAAIEGEPVEAPRMRKPRRRKWYRLWG